MKISILFLFLVFCFTNSYSNSLLISDSTFSVPPTKLDSVTSNAPENSITIRKQLLYSTLYGSIGALGGFVISLPFVANQSDGFEQGITMYTLTAIGATTGFIWGSYHGYNLEKTKEKPIDKTNSSVELNSTVFSFLIGSGSNLMNGYTKYSYNFDLVVKPKTRNNYFPNEYGVVFEVDDWYGKSYTGNETKVGLKFNYNLEKHEFLQSHFFYGLQAGISTGFREEKSNLITSGQKDFTRVQSNIYYGMQITFLEFLNCRFKVNFEPIGAQSFIQGKKYSTNDMFSIDAAVGMNLFTMN